MSFLSRSRSRIALAASSVVLVAVAAALAGSPGPRVVGYSAAHGSYQGVRPTAVGLPQIGERGTVGAGDLVATLRRYHDSGAYERDLTAVDAAARAYLDRRLTGRAERPRGRAAIVLDIDETSLSNYAGMAASGFSATGNVGPAVAGTGKPILPTRALYRDARHRGVAVFFVTGRPSLLSSVTQKNLKSAGYTQGWAGLRFKPADQSTAAFKSSTRAGLQRRGYDVLINVGDQESDLDGGHADRAFKLPNPFYFIAD